MSLPPYRDPYLTNKFFDCTRDEAYKERRPCLGSTNFCDNEFFHRLDPKHPFRDCSFVRYKHSDFLYKPLGSAVTAKDVKTERVVFATRSPPGSPRAGAPKPRRGQSADDANADRARNMASTSCESAAASKQAAQDPPVGVYAPEPERGTWGQTICEHHSTWRTAFPDRFPRLEGNPRDMNTGMRVYKHALDSIPNGRQDLDMRRLKFLEKTRGGARFHQPLQRWDRFRQGAPSIPQIPIGSFGERRMGTMDAMGGSISLGGRRADLGGNGKTYVTIGGDGAPLPGAAQPAVSLRAGGAFVPSSNSGANSTTGETASTSEV